MVSATILTTITIVRLMGLTAAVPVSIANFAQNANAKLETLTKSQMQGWEMDFVMMSLMLKAATLMEGTAVDHVSIPSTVPNVSALVRVLEIQL